MKRFSELTVRTQLLTLVIFMVVAVCAAVVVIFFAFDRSDAHMQRLRDDTLAQQLLIKRLADYYALDVVDTTFRVRNELMPAADGLALVEQARERANADWASLESARLTGDERAWLQQARNARVAADLAAARLIEALHKQDVPGLASFANTLLYPSIDPMTQALRELFELQRAEVEALLREQQATTVEARLFTVGMMTFGFLTIALMAASLLRGVVRGVESLTGQSRALQAGNLAADVSQHPSGELGELSRAFERMREAIVDQRTQLLDKERELEARLEGATRELQLKNVSLATRERQMLSLSKEPALDNGDLPRAYELIASAACKGLGVQRAGLWFFDDNKNAITCRHLLDKATGATTEAIELKRAAYPRYFAALDGGRVIDAHAARTDVRTAEFTAGYLEPLGIQSMLDVPIRYRGNVVGIICCEHVGEPRQWSDDEAFFASALADASTRALTASAEREAEQALRTLNAELEQRIERRTADLAKQGAFLQTLIDALPYPVFYKGPDARFRGFNKSYEQTFGVRSDALIGLRVLDLDYLPEADRKAYQAEDERCIREAAVATQEIAMPFADGRTHDTLYTVAGFRNADGSPGGLIGSFIDISQRKAAERAAHDALAVAEAAREQAQAAEQRVVGIADSVPGVVFEFVRDRDGRFTAPFLSDGIFDLCGVSREAVMADVSCYFATVLEEDMPDYAAAIERSASGNGSISHDFRIRHAATGELRWLQVRAREPVRGEDSVFWRGYVIDVTEQKQLEQTLTEAMASLRESEAQFRGFAENAQFLVWIAKPDFSHFYYMSPYWLQLSGDPASMLLEDPTYWIERVQGDRDAITAKVLAAGQGEFADVEFQFAHKDGSIRWCNLRGYPIRNEAGEIVQVSGITTDITQTKQLEAQLRESREEAESAARAKGDFLANMSHEIRTPMNAIIGLAHLALKTELKPRQRDYLNKIHTAGQSLLGIINDILDFSKIEAGKLHIDHIAFSLDSVLDNVGNLLSQRAVDKGVEFIISRSPEIPDQLVGDPLRLGQILINLAGNAVKFTERGEVEIIVEPQTILDDAAKLYFAVRDTGIGLTQSQLDRLFQSFSQADASTTRKYGGTGLGLAISKQLAELMDGEIGVESEYGRGSRFWFTACVDVARAQQRSPHAVPAPLRDLRVMIVDDNPTARDILGRHVRAMGFSYAEASSGERALTLLREADEPFRVVLLDWKMEGLDGVATARRIRELPNCADTRIIMVSGYSREDVTRQAEEAGVNGYLLKPVNPSLLLDTILQSLGVTEASEGASAHARSSGIDGSLAGKRALLVEDNEINRQIARELLQEAGMIVDEAENGQQALNMLVETEEVLYDVILMDMQMPVMDGVEATRQLRAVRRLASVPVIAMTANAMEQDRQRCLDAGMNDHLAKPIDVARLFSTLRHWLGADEAVGTSAPGAAADDEAPLPDLPGVDHAEGLMRVGNSNRRLRRAWLRFRDTQGDACGRVSDAVQRNDWETAQREAHTLKGVSATLGAHAIASEAALLEVALKGQEPDWAEHLELLRGLLARLVAGLDAIRTDAGTTAAEATIDGPRLAALLETLAGQVEDDDTRAAHTLDAIEQMLGVDGADGTLHAIREAINDYDFDAAKAPLSRCRLSCQALIHGAP